MFPFCMRKNNNNNNNKDKEVWLDFIDDFILLHVNYVLLFILVNSYDYPNVKCSNSYLIERWPVNKHSPHLCG